MEKKQTKMPDSNLAIFRKAKAKSRRTRNQNISLLLTFILLVAMGTVLLYVSSGAKAETVAAPVVSWKFNEGTGLIAADNGGNQIFVPVTPKPSRTPARTPGLPNADYPSFLRPTATPVTMFSSFTASDWLFVVISGLSVSLCLSGFFLYTRKKNASTSATPPWQEPIDERRIENIDPVKEEREKPQTKTKSCPVCNLESNEQSSFCDNCGYKFKDIKS
jgi:hypothetical protein